MNCAPVVAGVIGRRDTVTVRGRKCRPGPGEMANFRSCVINVTANHVAC
ncbi:hypothetical protein Pd630_LPD04423 [Rhodococcus opacus PD630]|nr:hypothetical protein Pd630_LPD04423 [Rhodococcus opacus PD630]